jgi:hypothetical protein
LVVVIRYPVELDSAASIDDRITRELLAALAKEPRLKLVGSGTPNIQAASNGAGPGPANTPADAPEKAGKN